MKNNSTKMILLFLAGLIIGAAIVWLCFGGCCKKHCDHQCQVVKPRMMKMEPVKIDTIVAKNYFHNYLFSPVSVDTLKALAINLEQYHAMSLILNADSTVTGFRIFSMYGLVLVLMKRTWRTFKLRRTRSRSFLLIDSGGTSAKPSEKLGIQGN